MRLTLGRKLGAVLLVPFAGSVVGLWVVAAMVAGTEGDAQRLNLTGRQRMLAMELRAWVHMVESGQEEARSGLAQRTLAFGAALDRLRDGGSLDGVALEPAPPEVHGELEALARAWAAARPELEVLASERAGTPAFDAAAHRLDASIPALAHAADGMANGLVRRAERLRSELLTTLAVMTALAFLTFLGGLIVTRRTLVLPIRSLDGAARAVSLGRAPSPVAATGDDELAELGATFDLMAAEVRRLVAALEERRRQSDHLVEAVPAGLAVLGPDLRVVRASRTFGGLLGLDEGAVTGATLGSLIPAAALEVAAHEVLASGAVRRGMRCVVRAAGGTTRSLHATLGPAAPTGEDAAGQVLLAIDDRTEEERLAAQISTAERRFLEAVEHASDAIVLMNSQGAVTYFNRSAERAFGWARSDILGRPLTELIPEELRSRHARGAGEAVVARGVEGLGVVREVEGLRKNGERFPIELTISSHDDGDELTFTGIIRDVTESKRIAAERLQIERALAAAKVAAAEAASETKSRFLAHMSHEMRTPLNGVLGMTQLALDSRLPPESRGYLETAMVAGQQLLSLISDVLDLAKIEAGRLELEAVPFDVQRAIVDAARVDLARAQAKGVSVRTDVGGGPLWRSGDAVRVKQVVTNLVGNAVKFTSNGEVVVGVAENEANGMVHITVRDTGIGIPASRLDAIFEPFTQGDETTTRRFGGTGLGLTISRLLVAGMGGRLWAESEPGRGSTFHVDLLLPVSVAPSGAHGGVADGAEPATPGVPPGLSVLLAEDNPINAKLATVLLERLGCAVCQVADGRAAVAACTERRFDAVLMDVQMPELDGYGATSEIRAHEAGLGRRTPIIALTANAMKGDETACLEAGMDGYLSKPISPATLRRELVRVVAPDRGGGAFAGGSTETPTPR